MAHVVSHQAQSPLHPGEPIGGDLARSNHEASLLTIQALLGWVSSSERFLLAIKACATDATRNAS
jgi:hypothetical protein